MTHRKEVVLPILANHPQARVDQGLEVVGDGRLRQGDRILPHPRAGQYGEPSALLTARPQEKGLAVFLDGIERFLYGAVGAGEDVDSSSQEATDSQDRRRTGEPEPALSQ